MAEEEPDILETAPELASDSGTKDAESVLVYVGSSEDGFHGAGQTMLLKGINRVLLGRASNPDELESERERGVLRIGVPTMWASSKHAELVLNPPNNPTPFEIRDLGSRNGTIVEGEQISEITAVLPGQIFEVGRSFWMLRRHPAPIADEDHSLKFDATGTANPTMRHLERALTRLAPGHMPILLIGETGVGKEFYARAIHRASGRKGEFVRCTLAGAPPSRVDTLLFGVKDDPLLPGAIKMAEGGTLFVDDVSDLSRDAQAKLLWAVTQHPALSDEGGGGVRVLSASLRNLSPMVASQRFRADLYSRLAGFEARLPSLRDRREDLALMTRVLLPRESGADIRLETAAFRRLLGHSWPFNVRELHQSLAAAISILSSPGTTITRDVLADVLRGDSSVPGSADGIRAMRQELVRQLVACDGDTSAVALNFGVDEDQIDRWLERFDIEPNQYRGLS
jgi:transcriptional regulator of acetoin/glycerol metabolism